MRIWTARVMAVLAIAGGIATASAASASAAPANQHVSHVNKPADWWWK